MPYTDVCRNNLNTKNLYNLSYPPNQLSDLTELVKTEVLSYRSIKRWSEGLTRSLSTLALNIVYHSKYSNKLKVFTWRDSYDEGTYYSDILQLKRWPTFSLIHALEDLGYLTYTPGGVKVIHLNGVKSQVDYASKIEITDGLLSLLEGYIQYDQITCQPESLIRLRVNKSPKRYKHHMRDQSRLSNPMKQLTRQRGLYQFNKLLADTDIVVATDIPQFIGCADKVYNRTYHEHIGDTGRFNNHGRYYAPLISSIKSDHRKHILFNGEPTVEIDIVSSHVMLAYALNGIDITLMDKPAYHIDGIVGDNISWGLDQAIVRMILKQALLIQFTTLDANKAAMALNNWVDDMGDVYWQQTHAIHSQMEAMGYEAKLFKKQSSNAKAARMIVDALRKKHHLLGSWFKDRDANGKLCFIESEIITDVIAHFTPQGVPCLPVHDSIVIGESYAIELNKVLTEAVRSRTGLPFKYSEKLTKGLPEKAHIGIPTSENIIHLRDWTSQFDGAFMPGDYAKALQPSIAMPYRPSNRITLGR